MKQGRIVIAGGMGLDMIPIVQAEKSAEGEVFFSQGGSLELKNILYCIGGQTGNTGRVLRKLGADVCIQSKVGNDMSGKMIQELLDIEKIEGIIDVSSEEKTSSTFVLSPPNQDRMFLYCRGASQTFKANDINLNLLELADFFHFGYPPSMKHMYTNDGKELLQLMCMAKNTGVTTSMDMCMPDINSEAGQVDWTKVLSKVLPYVDIFVPSIEEISYMLNKEAYLKRKQKKEDFIDNVSWKEIQIIADQLLNMGANVVMIKCGYKGLYLKSKKLHKNLKLGRGLCKIANNWSEKVVYAPPYKVENMVCANGAGDSAVAGLLISMSRKKEPEVAIKLSAATAADSLTSFDVAENICSLEILEDKISGWETRPLLDIPPYILDNGKNL